MFTLRPDDRKGIPAALAALWQGCPESACATRTAPGSAGPLPSTQPGVQLSSHSRCDGEPRRREPRGAQTAAAGTCTTSAWLEAFRKRGLGRELVDRCGTDEGRGN